MPVSRLDRPQKLQNVSRSFERSSAMCAILTRVTTRRTEEHGQLMPRGLPGGRKPFTAGAAASSPFRHPPLTAQRWRGRERRSFGRARRLFGREKAFLGREHFLFGREQAFSSREQSLLGPEKRLFGPEKRLFGPEKLLLGPEKRFLGPEKLFFMAVIDRFARRAGRGALLF
jgi:hypothetical protein